MEKSNVEFILAMAEELRRENVGFFFLDERWMVEGRDVDLCLYREDTEKFDKIAREMGFRFLSKFPPWKRFYVVYREWGDNPPRRPPREIRGGFEGHTWVWRKLLARFDEIGFLLRLPYWAWGAR